jgi:hypothetical protein
MGLAPFWAPFHELIWSPCSWPRASGSPSVGLVGDRDCQSDFIGNRGRGDRNSNETRFRREKEINKITPSRQGCQMVQFSNLKIPIWVNFREYCNGRCWFILCPFSLFTDNWYLLWSFGIFFPVLICCTKENLATLLCVRDNEMPKCLSWIIINIQKPFLFPEWKLLNSF